MFKRFVVLGGLLVWACSVAMATSDVRVVGPLSVKPVTGSTTTVSVANFPATQPVSGTVAVSNFPATQPVSGTFWQATQPVSGPLTNTELRLSSVPVTVSNVATATNQTSGGQKTQVIDAGGNTAVLVSPSAPESAWNEKGVRVLIGPTDPISNLPVFVDYDHHQLHEGEIFRWSVLGLNGLNANSNKDLLLVVPNISTTTARPSRIYTSPHLRFEVVTDGAASIYLYEGATVSSSGTVSTPVAMERNGTYTSGLIPYEGPTVISTGTATLFQGLLGGSKNSAGTTENSSIEFVLRNNTKYLMRLTSATAGLKYVIRLLWYEDLGI